MVKKKDHVKEETNKNMSNIQTGFWTDEEELIFSLLLYVVCFLGSEMNGGDFYYLKICFGTYLLMTGIGNVKRQSSTITGTDVVTLIVGTIGGTDDGGADVGVGGK